MVGPLEPTSQYWLRRTTLSRRAALRGGVALAGGLAGAALLGCDGDDDTSDDGDGATGTAAATAAGGTGTAAATATAGSDGEVKRGGIYQTHTSSDPPSIDINTTVSFAARSFAAYVYSRLYMIDAQPGKNPFEQGPIGDLAESAETEDGATWTVKIKQGVKFQNIEPVSGRELTTEDVLFSWGKLTAETSTLRGAVANITGVEAVDPYTLRFTHEAPNADFLEQLADGFLFWVTPTESDGGFNPAEVAIGSGPWIMEDYEVSNRFVFKANPDYHVAGIPYMDGVEQSIIPEYANQLAQFQAGNVMNLSARADDVLQLRSQMPDTQWLSRVGTGMYGLFFSPEEQDPDAVWRDERFRIASSYAVDRGALLEFLYNVSALQGAGLDVSTNWNNQVAVGMGERWWLDPLSDAQGESRAYFEYNPAESKKLLDAIGVPSDAIPFAFTNNRYSSVYTDEFEALEGWLTDAGFNLQVDAQDYSSQFITQTWQGRFSGMALGNFGGFSSLSGYLGEQIGEHPENKRLLHSEDMLDLFRRQGQEIDIEARAELVHELQRTNAENMYIVPTNGGGGTNFVAHQPQVRGIRDTRGLGGPTEQTAVYWLDT
jgi:peptide/nickel transport system substrate-binding protein